MPIIEYASSCWGPTSKHLNNALEMVQHNAAKFVTNRYPRKDNFHKFSISKLLQGLEWDSLEERRNKVRLTMAYKIINGLLILEPSLMPKMRFKRPVRECKPDSQNQLIEPESRLGVTGSTFFYATPKLWNNAISLSHANAPSVDTFKRHLKKK